MRKKIFRSVLGISLAVALALGNAGVASAAEPVAATQSVEAVAETEEATDTDAAYDTAAAEAELAETQADGVVVETEDIVGEGEEAAPEVTWLEAKIDGSSILAQWELSNASYAEVYINDVSYDSYAYGSIQFYRAVPGTTYTIKVIPRTYDGVKGTAKTASVTIAAPKITNVTANVNSTSVGQTAYSDPGIYVRADVDQAGSYTYNVQRKEGKGSWKTVDTVSCWGSIYYHDSDVKVGQSYSYRFQCVAEANEYSKAYAGPVSAASKACKLELTANGGVEYTMDGVVVYSDGYYWSGDSFATGYELYRSTNKKKGYKKIATMYGSSYNDKKAKSGTYYYKLKPFWRDTKTNKVYYGKMSDPMGVKIRLSALNTWTSHKGTNKIKISWDKVKGATNYEVYVKSNLAGDAYKLYKKTTGTECTVKGLSEDSYSYQVLAYKVSGGVKQYYVSSSGTMYKSLYAPENVRITKRKVAASGDKFTVKTTIRWDRVYGAKKLQVVDYSNGKYVVIKTLKASATSYTLTNVRTKSGYVTSDKYSNIIIRAVKGDDYRDTWVYGTMSLDMPKKVTVKKSGATTAKVSWTKVSGATNYGVFRVNKLGKSVCIGNTDKTYFEDSTFAPSTPYTYYVIPNNGKFWVSGDATYAAKEYKHSIGVPAINKIENYSYNTGTATILFKPATGGHVTYEIYRATSAKGKYTKVKSVLNPDTRWYEDGSCLVYEDKNLKKGSTYYYKIKAIAYSPMGKKCVSKLSAAKSVTIAY